MLALRMVLIGLVVSIVMVLMASVAGADVVAGSPLTVATRIGGFNAPGHGGAYGFVSATIAENAGHPSRAMFGATFEGRTLVETLTIEQYGADGRRRPKNVRVYTTRTDYVTITLADTYDEQTVDLTAFNGGQPILAKPYLILIVEDQYGSGDMNWGVMDYSFTGTYVGPAEVNLNATAVNVYTTHPLNGYDKPDVTVDGQIASITTNTSSYWMRDATGPDTLVVEYDGAKTVGEVGLGLAGDMGGRDAPKYVTVSDSHGNSEQITLLPNQMQYQRYELTHPFIDTTSLTLTFPDGTALDDWYVNGDLNYGVTEFQAFVPEPASLAVLAFGAAGLGLRRRRN